MNYPNVSGYLLQQWTIKCNDRIGNGKIQNFIKSSKGSTLTPNCGHTSIPPFGDSFLYIETRVNNYGENVNVYCSFKRPGIIQISNMFLL